MRTHLIFKHVVAFLFANAAIHSTNARMVPKETLCISSAVSIKPSPSFFKYKGGGLLKPSWQGKTDLLRAKDILDAFVDFTEDDKELLRKYIRTDLPGFTLEKIREVVMDQLSVLEGVSPSQGQIISAERAHQIIEEMQPSAVTYADWKTSGLRSVFLLNDGSATIGYWIPNTRTTGTILSWNGRPVFDLYCLNPIIKPSSPDVITPLPRIPEQQALITPTTGGITVVNNNYNYNNNVTASDGNAAGGDQELLLSDADQVRQLPQAYPVATYPVQYDPPYTPPYVYQQPRRVPVRVRVNLNFGRNPSRGYYPPRSGYGGNYFPPPRTSPPRRYNTSSLNPIVPSNYGGSVGRRR